MTDRFHATPEDVERSGIADDPLVWIAVETNPNCERKVVDGLFGSGFVAYCPLTTKWHRPRRRGKAALEREARSRPLIVGYVFVGMPGLKKNAFDQIRCVNGVRRIVIYDGKPYPIPSWQIEALMDRESRGVFDETRPTQARYHAGDQVKVMSGPFVGKLGEVVEEISDGKLLVEIIGLFGHGASVPLDDDHVEAMAA